METSTSAVKRVGLKFELEVTIIRKVGSGRLRASTMNVHRLKSKANVFLSLMFFLTNKDIFTHFFDENPISLILLDTVNSEIEYHFAVLNCMLCGQQNFYYDPSKISF